METMEVSIDIFMFKILAWWDTRRQKYLLRRLNWKVYTYNPLFIRLIFFLYEFFFMVIAFRSPNLLKLITDSSNPNPP